MTPVAAPARTVERKSNGTSSLLTRSSNIEIASEADPPDACSADHDRKGHETEGIQCGNRRGGEHRIRRSAEFRDLRAILIEHDDVVFARRHGRDDDALLEVVDGLNAQTAGQF